MKKTFFLMLLAAFAASAAHANVEQTKIYKKVFEGEKPKCGGCHASEKPKKESAELNDYGKKVMELKAQAASPDEAAYKAAGKIPETA